MDARGDYRDKTIVITNSSDRSVIGKVGVVRGRNQSDMFIVQVWTKQVGAKEQMVIVPHAGAKFFDTTEEAQSYSRKFLALK